MLDVRDLEDRWKKYNRKRKKPIVIILILLSILIFGLLFFKNGDIPKYISKVFSYNIFFKDNIVEKSQEINNTTIKKSIYLLDQYIIDLESKQEDKDNINLDNKSVDTLSPLDEDEVFIEKEILKPIIKKKNVNIIKVSTNSAYKDVEKRFRRSHNINDSIFLANMYYKKQNYKKAIYWSMQTNKLDKNIEESWLIFVKSKVRLGHKNEAIRVLKAYIKRSNSYEAKKLLKKLIN